VFDDDEERPVPVRRVQRARTLPPPPPAPGDRVPRSRRRRQGRVLGVIALGLIGIAGWLLVSLFQPFAGEGDGQVRVTVPSGSTSADVGDQLEKAGVVSSSFFFTMRARLDGTELKAGQYTLKKGMSYAAALDALDTGPAAPKTVRVTIPEGRSRREAMPLVEQAGLEGSYLQASERSKGFNPARYGAPKNVESLEGFLFPATYELKPGATARTLVGQQLAAFQDSLAEVDQRKARRRNLTTYDVLIIASMVEREASIDKERPLVAAVIHNRLKQGMPLGIDATIRFATRNWTEPLKQSELDIDSPYNTRRRTGLPPGPIGSPGLASIKAAANPADVDFLFYVVKPNACNEHSFSSTDAEFQEDVAAYNRERDKRGGKSPTTC
jgi:uncharacterized YceG family protein